MSDPHYPLVLIGWKDHETHDNWADVDKAAIGPLPLIHTVGWLVREDDECYVTAAAIGTDHEGCQFFKILKGAVVSFKRLSKPPRKKCLPKK